MAFKFIWVTSPRLSDLRFSPGTEDGLLHWFLVPLGVHVSLCLSFPRWGSSGLREPGRGEGGNRLGSWNPIWLTAWKGQGRGRLGSPGLSSRALAELHGQQQSHGSFLLPLSSRHP